VKVWIKICKEYGVNVIEEVENQPYTGYTMVPYLSDSEVDITAESRSQTVKNLGKRGIAVFGGCAPVSKHVVRTVRGLHGKELNEDLIALLERKNRKYSPYRYSRAYQSLLEWLKYNLRMRRGK